MRFTLKYSSKSRIQIKRSLRFTGCIDIILGKSNMFKVFQKLYLRKRRQVTAIHITHPSPVSLYFLCAVTHVTSTARLDSSLVYKPLLHAKSHPSMSWFDRGISARFDTCQSISKIPIFTQNIMNWEKKLALMTNIQYGWHTSVILEQLGHKHFLQRFGISYLFPNTSNT